MRDDIPFSDWITITRDFKGPKKAGLVEFRTTRGGEPQPVEYPKATDTGGTLYIKACDDIRKFVLWFFVCLHDPKILPMHPAALAYHSHPDAKELWPIEGLQVRYVTGDQLVELEKMDGND